MKISELIAESRRKTKSRKNKGRRAGAVYTGWGWPGYGVSDVGDGGGGDGGGVGEQVLREYAQEFTLVRDQAQEKANAENKTLEIWKFPNRHAYVAIDTQEDHRRSYLRDQGAEKFAVVRPHQDIEFAAKF